MLHAKARAELVRLALECGRRLRIFGRDPGHRAERKGDERMPEEKALHLGERQYADYFGAPHCEEVVCAMTEATLDHLAPFEPMEERRLARARDECGPASRVLGREPAYFDRRHFLGGLLYRWGRGRNERG